MIEHIIHQIWVGDKLPPTDLMNTWKSSDFEYILWDEISLNKLEMINRDKYDYFIKEKIYYGAADVARVEILYNYGGLYIDADTEKIKDFPTEWFNYDFFAAKVPSGLITNSVMASKKQGNLISEYRNKILLSKKIKPCWNTIGAKLLTDIITNCNYQNDILVLEPYTFYPNYRGIIDKNASSAYANHRWGSKTKYLYKSV